MKCPFCGYLEHRVLETRMARDGQALRRRRECERCNHRFTTYEEAEKPRVFLVKRDGSREEFNREKLLAGMLIACRKRPIEIERLKETAENIEQEIYDLGEIEIPSREVGARVMEKLLTIDAVAYVRFASVYEQFESTAEFSKVVNFVKSNTKSRQKYTKIGDTN